MSKYLYKSSSILDFGNLFIMKIAAGIAVFFALMHFNENPVVISIFSGVCFLLILFLGTDIITVYRDRIEISSGSPASLLFGFRKRTYPLSEMKKIYLQELGTSGERIAGGLARMFSGSQRNSTSKTIYIDKPDGETITILVDADYLDLKTVVNMVNSLISK